MGVACFGTIMSDIFREAGNQYLDCMISDIVNTFIHSSEYKYDHNNCMQLLNLGPGY